MVYKHPNFVLDPDQRLVWDENGKELRLTGNAYRVLEFLCKNESGTVTEIGDYLDWAKDYDENNIRQYRYKINTVIGHDVVDYQNGIYRISGIVEEFGDRNTDVLRPDTDTAGDVKNNVITFSIIPGLLSIVVLLLTFLDWPYGYYTLVRIIVTASTAYYAYLIWARTKEFNWWCWVLVGITVLFNPVVPVYLGVKAIWSVIDVVVAVFLGVVLYKWRIKLQKELM